MKLKKINEEYYLFNIMNPKNIKPFKLIELDGEISLLNSNFMQLTDE